MFESQQQISFSQGQGIVIEVKGTSSLHDWSMESTGADVTASFLLENGEIQDMNFLSFSVPVKSLKSDKSRMDRNASGSFHHTAGRLCR